MTSATASRTVVVVVLALGLFVAAVAPSVALVANQDDYEVADGRTGGVDPGREDDEDQVFPINYTYLPVTREPGNTNGAYEVYASGLTENITGHWVVLESADFGFSSCTSGDASAFGIDRGNDDPGTQTDVSLITAYKSYTSTEDGIYIEFYKESALAGEPIKAFVDDQIVAKQNNCMNNPSEPGWYRLSGHINGSTKHDTTTDYKIYAGTQYVYVCECSSREEAREKLGPPPNEQGGSQASTPEPTATAAATATATPAAPDETATPRATATAVEQSQTATEHQPSNNQPDEQPATATAGATTTSTGQSAPTAQNRRGGAGTATVTISSPTLAEGPGFGVRFAVLALAVAGLLALRRRE
ncbi:hypothetical protein [Halorarius litoreus]|uniref:hypothetical protein n=1 Tax=Halorarius litoreus TaxID=2962676 RepID=UPI0020CBA436|nr:hypothetical protein [Halorarius litoreus]